MTAIREPADGGRPIVRRAAHDRIPRVSRTDALPPSFAQQRLWFIDGLVPERGVYNVPAMFEVRGALEVAVLRRCLAELMDRHEPLRTAFAEVSGKPSQVVAEPGALAVPLWVRDLRGVPGDRRAELVTELAREQGSRPFDLADPPLWSAGLLCVAGDRHVLLLTMHHVMVDAWSIPQLLEELAELYPAFADAAPSPLEPLAVQYVDYAVWQQQRLCGPRLEALVDYWRKTLSGAPGTAQLPTDRPRPAAFSYRGDAVEFEIPADVRLGVERLARSLRASPFHVMLTAFKVLLWRYTRQSDVVVGTPVANRLRPELADMVGFFTNMLVLRTDLTGDPPFTDLVARVRASTLAALDHQELPFERLVAELHPERNLAHHPLFQVQFAMASIPKVWQVRPGLEIRWLPAVRNGTAKFDLSLLCYDESGTLRGAAEYATDLFDRATIERMVDQYLTVLRTATANPVTQISRLDLLPAGDRRAIAAQWTGPDESDPCDEVLGELLRRQAVATPAAVALEVGRCALTYAELDDRATRLARLLRTLGVGPDVPVAICLERSVALAEAVLAVLGAGGAYLPLDPDHPAHLREYMLSDTSPAVLVTHSALLPRLAAHTGHVVLVDRDEPAIARARTDLDAHAHPDNLAYVMYTSGSTGRPKGVAVTHRMMVNLMRWHNRELVSGARTLQFATFSFDMSIYEMLAAWLSGGALVMLDEAGRRDPAELLRVLADRRVVKAMLPVPVLQQLAEFADAPARERLELREVLTAGDRLVITPAVAELFRGLPRARLHNHYGPAETHVVTGHPLPADPNRWPARPPLGRPIPNTRVYLLDQAMRLVPVGVPGELYIGGDCLARGYVRRADLTAERFVPDAVSGRPGQRLYRTGDLARIGADGELHFVGRADHQVKIRGFRVEPGEVESALRRHPAVRNGVVVAWRPTDADARLVAYAVGEPELTADSLRAHLKQHLPEYLVPAVIMVLDELPLTANRKVDRGRLPEPVVCAGPGHVAPRTAVERGLAGVWSAVLRADPIGVHDDFFDLGGHSLLATQITARIRTAFGVAVSLGDLFTHPTIAQLAAVVETARPARADPDDIIARTRAEPS